MKIQLNKRDIERCHANLRGRVRQECQLPTGGKARERILRMTRCNSEADGIVRMKEG